jgi:hypothetical protein
MIKQPMRSINNQNLYIINRRTIKVLKMSRTLKRDNNAVDEIFGTPKNAVEMLSKILRKRR